MNQQGVSTTAIVIILAALFAVAGGVWFFTASAPETETPVVGEPVEEETLEPVAIIIPEMSIRITVPDSLNDLIWEPFGNQAVDGVRFSTREL